MDKKIAKRWCQALRSGKYNQVTDNLAFQYNDEQIGYCCLGVLCELYNKSHGKKPLKPKKYGKGEIFSFYGEEMHLPTRVMKWAGIKSTDGMYSDAASLAIDNDDGKTFKQIAKIIEKQVENL